MKVTASQEPAHAPRNDAGVEGAVQPLGGRPPPRLSREAYAVVQCLDGYLKTLLPEGETTPTAALVPQPSLKRARPSTQTDASSRKVALRPLSDDSSLISQLIGEDKMASRPREPKARPERVDGRLNLSPEREQIINDALSSAMDGSALIKPVFWPHFEMIVDVSFLRLAYPDVANKPTDEVAHAVGGMVDRDLQGFGELWRQRHRLGAAQFMAEAEQYLRCPISLMPFQMPVLTLEGRNVSLPALAEYHDAYRGGWRSLYGGPMPQRTSRYDAGDGHSALPLAGSIYGYPNRRIIAICDALFVDDASFVASDIYAGRGFWEAGALFREWSTHMLARNLDAQAAPELSVEQAAHIPRQDDPALARALEDLERIDSIEAMMAPYGGRDNPRGELLHRALSANQLLFTQLVHIVEDMRAGRALHDGRVRLACDAALINAPVHSSRSHLIKHQAPIFIAALRQSNDLGSIVRRIFFEQTLLERHRDVVEPLLRPIDVNWLRQHDRRALPYLQMSWSAIFHPSAIGRTRWSESSSREKLNSLTYALWVETRDFNLTTLFLPFEDMTPMGAQLSEKLRKTWESQVVPQPSPWTGDTLHLARSRASSFSSTRSLRQHLEDLAGSGLLVAPALPQRGSSLRRGRSMRAGRSARSARQSRESLLLSGSSTPSSERQITLADQRSEVS